MIEQSEWRVPNIVHSQMEYLGDGGGKECFVNVERLGHQNLSLSLLPLLPLCAHICGDAVTLRFLGCVPVNEQCRRQGVKLRTFF